jgi:hypothetical protein
MNKLFLCLNLIYFSCKQAPDRSKWIESLPKPHTLSEKEFEVFLPQFKLRFPEYQERLKAFNHWRIDTPYGLFCLGEETGIDKDPIIRNDSSDCTVHILTTLAFAESDNYLDARNIMKKIHYKKDENGLHIPTYKSRWHFTSDRILNNPKMLDITPRIVQRDSLEVLNIELNRKENGGEFLQLGWTSKIELKFLPIEVLSKKILKRLPEVCGIAFVKRSYFKLGIVIAHEGFLIDNFFLFHASSEFGKTVKIDLFEYIKTQEKFRFDGVMFYDLIEG